VKQPDPAVSVITIFYNEARFLPEAIESVLSQTYSAWELLLVDDGSSDESTEIALRYAAAYPQKIRYLEHEGHTNRGMSAARNLGLRHARGRYLAFVDADDVWLPHKLASQIPRLDALPEVDMLYATTEYWHSWTGSAEDRARDHLWKPVENETIFAPPELLRLFLDRKILMPCIGSILVRRKLVEDIGGWEESFRGLHEDQVFFAKICLNAKVAASPLLVDRYRQHPDSCCAVVGDSPELHQSKERFLDWLADHLVRFNVADSECWRALARERQRA